MQAYSVYFKLWDALSLETSTGNPEDIFCVVECHDQRYQTETLIEVRDHAVFNATCTWPEVMLYDKEFESAFIEFSVYERCWFTRNILLGKASLQLAHINKHKSHLYSRTWLPLRVEDDTAPKGKLNVTVYCLKAGQPAPSKQEQETFPRQDDDGTDAQAGAADMEDLSGAVLRPHLEAEKGNAYYVVVNIFRVDDLAPTSWGSLPSPFVTVEFNGAQCTTRKAPPSEQYSFLESAKIPVRTPIYEDTILIKLWSHNRLSPDELLAQGLISFSELRNYALAPKWFNLYGWDQGEVPDLATIVASGERVEPNVFKGRILISGAVKKVDEDEALQPARVLPAPSTEEPQTRQVAIFPDAYLVVGVQHRQCKVDMRYAGAKVETKWVTYQQQKTKITGAETSEDDEEINYGDDQGLRVFYFGQSDGRMKPLLSMTPSDPDSQPDVMINVSVKGLLHAEQRVAWSRHKLMDFAKYEAGNPSRPRFIDLKPMPGTVASGVGASVLISIEHHTTDDVLRHNRREVKEMQYIVRAYCFMARSIRMDETNPEQPSRYELKISCSGVAKWTSQTPKPSKREQDCVGVRPMWMEHVDLKVVLFSDSRTEPPTVEPITVSLNQYDGSLVGGPREIGKAVCVYTLPRQKDRLDKWDPYQLRPQWIQVYGGTYGNLPVGEVLIGFELLQWKQREEMGLYPKEMWPQPDDNFTPDLHFCRLRKATLHFAMMGLRDLPPLPRKITGGALGSVHVELPEVTVSCPSFRNPEDDDGEGEQDPLVMRYEDVVKGGDKRLKEFCLRRWKSKAGVYAQGGWQGSLLGEPEFMNFEFLHVGKLKVEIPEKMIFQPYIKIQVEEVSGTEGISGYLFGRTLIGESLQSLAEYLPCCWYPGVRTDLPYEDQKEHIAEMVKKAQDEAAARPTFQQMSLEAFEKLREDVRRQEQEHQLMLAQQVVKMDSEKPTRLDNTGLPIQLRFADPRAVRPLKGFLKAKGKLNMHLETPFSPRKGPEIRSSGEDSARPTVNGRLENCSDFIKSLWFQNTPLLRNHDIIEPDDEIDWNFAEHHGFIKCAFKLVDGWEPEVAEDADAPEEDKDGMDDDDDGETDEQKLRETYDLDPELVKFGFDQKKFQKKFKKSENIPSRIKVRIYLLRAICIFAKGTGFADPYLEFQLGRNISISMKNIRQPHETNTPEFLSMQERDIELPFDSRLEVTLMDNSSLGIRDEVIGSTVIDLEDRWHSIKWNKLSERQMIHIENRPVFRPGEHDKNHGSIELFIEMLDASMASDRKAAVINAAKGTDVQIRVVVKTAEVFFLDEDKKEKIDLTIGGRLFCETYNGDYPDTQETDAHLACKGNAQYNWRIVFDQISERGLETCELHLTMLKYQLIAGNELLASPIILDMKKWVLRCASDLERIDIPETTLKFMGNGEDETEEMGSVTILVTVLTETEAVMKPAGWRREDPNNDPELYAPTEGRGWDDYFESLGFAIPWPSWWKKLIPLIISAALFLAGVVVMKQLGLV